MKPFLHRLRDGIALRVVEYLLRGLIATLRFEIIDEGGIIAHPPSGPLLFTAWHNRLLILGPVYRHLFPGRPICVLVSQSRDGELLTRILARFGIQTARGSTSKQGSGAIREVLRRIKAGNDSGITPDGPRGPRGIVKPGIVQAARISGAPIVTLAYTLGWKKELRSWDRFQIPLPFSTCRFVWGAPIPIPADVTPAEIDAWCLHIAEKLGE